MVKLNDRAHQIRVKRLLREDRKIVFKTISDTIDAIRFDAVSNIIPNIVGKKMSPARMAKLQPSVPGKLTERTGRLIKMLQSKGTWNITSQRANLTTNSLKGIVKVSSGKNLVSERYVGTLRAAVDDANPFIGQEFGAIQRRDPETGKIINFFRPVTKQSLVMRFKWETGIRGKKRQFIDPSAKRKIAELPPLFASRLERLKTI
jgi:hypothetical protein